MVVFAEKIYSPEEYLALEQESEFKNEYCDGVIVAMAGVQPPHNTIVSNFHGETYSRLKAKGCRAAIADQRVKSSVGNQYTYPDLVLVCGEPHYELLQGLETLTNPTVIIEVLSPSTQDTDRTTKWFNYQRIPSLQDYVMIWQNKARIEHFSRTDNDYWGYQLIEGLENTFALEQFALQVALAAIYDGVILETDEI